MASGDLDREVDTTEYLHHDEAVAAYTDDDHWLQVRVIDYDANSGALLATPPDQELPVVGTQRDGLWYPGSVNVAVGDFDANGRNEIAVTWQDAGGLDLTVLRYAATESGSRELTVIGRTRSSTRCPRPPWAEPLGRSPATVSHDWPVGVLPRRAVVSCVTTVAP